MPFTNVKIVQNCQIRLQAAILDADVAFVRNPCVRDVVASNSSEPVAFTDNVVFMLIRSLESIWSVGSIMSADTVLNSKYNYGPL